MEELKYDPKTATPKQFTVDVIPLSERPWLKFEVRCSACKWGVTFIMMTVARAFFMNHRCGICGCCGNTTIDGAIFCGDTCIAQGGSCDHPLRDALQPVKKEESLIIM